MSAIEDRIRQALDADVLVSADEVLGAAVIGIRRRRRRQAVAISVATVAAVVLGVVAGNAVSRRTAEPVVPIKKPTPQVHAAPSPLDWYSGIATDGTTLYLASHRCPGKLVAGHCTYPSSFTDAVSLEKAFPVVLWRYADKAWERLGAPGVTDLATMHALPGGLLLVPRVNDPDTTLYETGPLKVSLDRGTTWRDWPLPWPGTKRCLPDFSSACRVAVSGDYVVVSGGDAWARRSIRSGGWEDVSPPRRGAMHPFDDHGWGLLALADGTLVATANQVGDEHPGIYRVSRDIGRTWSAPHEAPGDGTATLDRVEGDRVLAGCSNQSQACGEYWSTDLETWTRAPLGHVYGPLACGPPSDGGWRLNEGQVQVGNLRYRLATVRYLDGRLATAAELPSPDRVRHQIRRVLQLSTDDCRTWRPLLD